MNYIRKIILLLILSSVYTLFSIENKIEKKNDNKKSDISIDKNKFDKESWQQKKIIKIEKPSTSKNSKKLDLKKYPINKTIPLGMENKRQLTQEQLAKKQESWYYNPLPIVTYDSDTGVGYGAIVFIYWNGERKNPFFKYTPYQEKLSLQLFKSTEGVQYHWLSYDAPYFFNSLFRLRADLIFEKNINANYFGVEEESRQKLTLPSALGSTTYDTMVEYNEELRKQRGLTTYSYYNKYEYYQPIASFTLEKEVLGGLIRPLINFRFEKITINDYTNELVKTDEEDAIMETTKLLEDQLTGKIKGFDGGWNNGLKIAVSYDTRDFQPDPTQGIYTEITYEMYSKILGSQFEYQQFSISPKFYYSPFPQFAKVVIAGQGYYAVKTGDVPFYFLNSISRASGNTTGLGGIRTLRGYVANRFIGKVIAFANLEIRYTFWELTTSSQRFAFMIVPFFDIGRTFDKASETNLTDYKYTFGGALRVAWNQATIIMADYGVSEEGSGLYINFGHIF